LEPCPSCSTALSGFSASAGRSVSGPAFERAEQRIQALRDDIAARLLSGNAIAKADLAAVVEAEAEVSALQAAQAEQVRRSREAVSKADAVRLAQARAALQSAEHKRLKAVGDAEAASRALATALAELKHAAREVNQHIAALGARPVLPLEPGLVLDRVVRCFCTVVAGNRDYGNNSNPMKTATIIGWVLWGLTIAFVAFVVFMR